MKTRVTLAIGITIALAFLVLALRETELSLIVSSLSQSDFRFVPIVASALMLQFWFKAVRWKLLLQPFTHATSRQVFPATVVGYLANLVFPLYIGEIARVYILGQQLGLRYTPVLATVVLERFFDFLSVLFFVGLVLIIDPKVPPVLYSVGVVAGAASLALLILLAVFLRWTGPITRMTLKAVAFLSASARDKIAEQINLGVMGLQSIRNLRDLPGIVVTSLLQWGAMGACVYAGMLGTGVDVPLSAGFVVLALTVMAVILPSSPGFFGTIQLCFTLGLAAYGVLASQAFAASVFFHLTIYVTGWSAGLYFLRQSGLTLGGLRRVSIDQQSATPDERV